MDNRPKHRPGPLGRPAAGRRLRDSSTGAGPGAGVGSGERGEVAFVGVGVVGIGQVAA